jgi:glycine/D-amino acid oxidase-like deaminating enzyme
MTEHRVDVLICGGGIAGLWLLADLRARGYDAALIERDAIGCGQTVASQGIIHSGLKYAFAGQINTLAKSISAMPDLWRDALKGIGPVDLRAAQVRANSQYLLIPQGFMGGLINLVTRKALGNNVHALKKSEWPEDITRTGFDGSVIFMDEPVLDIPSTLRALATPHQDRIFKADLLNDIEWRCDDTGAISDCRVNGETISASLYIFTAAESNKILADRLGHSGGLETQERPLLMGMMRGAPCELYAHCVGPAEKPIMTITTHVTQDGEKIWYLGGSVAERATDANPAEVYDAAKAAFKKYMPSVPLENMTWSVLPINRVEGKSKIIGHMPDTPTLHPHKNALYAWPTKLTFAPLLAREVEKHLNTLGLKPSKTEGGTTLPLPPCPITQTPWDKAEWKTV